MELLVKENKWPTHNIAGRHMSFRAFARAAFCIKPNNGLELLSFFDMIA
jgi:hypothetical protein